MMGEDAERLVEQSEFGGELPCPSCGGDGFFFTLNGKLCDWDGSGDPPKGLSSEECGYCGGDGRLS